MKTSRWQKVIGWKKRKRIGNNKLSQKIEQNAAALAFLFQLLPIVHEHSASLLQNSSGSESRTHGTKNELPPQVSGPQKMLN